MEGSCSTGQSPQRAVVPVEEEEEEEEEEKKKKKILLANPLFLSHPLSEDDGQIYCGGISNFICYPILLMVWG
jgi:hypothetical protein